MAERHDMYMWEGMEAPSSSSDVPHISENQVPLNRLNEHHGRHLPPVPQNAMESSPSQPHGADLYQGPSSTTSNLVSQTSQLVVPQPLKVHKLQAARSYQCKMCEQMFDTKADMMLHSQHVHKQDPRPYKCQTCTKSFANSSYLSQHNRIHLGIKPYGCRICDRKFTQLSHMQQHLRTHTGEKPYKCQHPGCVKSFSQLSNLQSHSRSHMTDKPYRCNSCYKCFTDEVGLREHIPKHANTKLLKTHICQVCGKSYTQAIFLERHMQKHSFGSNGPRRNSAPPQGTPLQEHHQENHPEHHQEQQHHQDPHQEQQPSHLDPNHHQSQGLIKQESFDSGKSDASNGGAHTSPKHSAFNSVQPQQQYSHVPHIPNTTAHTAYTSFGLPPPRVPHTNTSMNPSALPNISSLAGAMPYFPYDPTGFRPMEPERPLVTRESMLASTLLRQNPEPLRNDHLNSREGMIASSLLRLHDIKNYTSHHIPSMMAHAHPDSHSPIPNNKDLGKREEYH
ncbi:unnamed protein product [Owenia fusiformis]|nr:unnamed protein product [Owenia fusiformis]